MFSIIPWTRRWSDRSSRERTSDEQNLRIMISKLGFLIMYHGGKGNLSYLTCTNVLQHISFTLCDDDKSSETKLGSSANSMKRFLWQAAPRRVSTQWLRPFLHKTAVVSLLIFSPPPAVSVRSRFCCWSCEPWRPLPPPEPKKLSGELNWLIKYSQICKHTVDCWSVPNCKCYRGNFT